MKDKPPLAARSVLYVISLLILSFVIWAHLTEIDEIARGEGKVIPVSKTQIIQSSEPGVVQEIAVVVGQVVRKGDLIIRLDDTATGASLGEAEAKARSLKAQIARLEIEAEGQFDKPYACPAELEKAAPGICTNEARLLKSRADNYQNKLSVLKERREQRLREASEVKENIERLENNVIIIQQEIDLLAPIVKRKLAAQTDLLRVQKEFSDTQGQIKSLREQLEKLGAAVNEATLQVDELGLQLEQEALAAKTEALAQLSVIEETIRGASSRVKNTDIRTPVDGIINNLEVNTIGAYVNPGAVVAGIVPTSDTLMVEARLSPKDVAFVRPGQETLIKVTAYDFSIYGGLKGTVDTVSADSLLDQNTGETFYQVRVRTDSAILTKDGRDNPIMPGMIASVDIMTGKKSILAYLLKPINKARSEALRER